jgi:hypothetical protein
MDHIMTSCTTSDDALLNWTLAKRKMIVHKYGTLGGHAHAHAALLSDASTDAIVVMPTLDERTDEYDYSEVSVPFSSVAFSSSLALGRDMPQFWVIDSACSINLTTFRGDFVTFDPPSVTSHNGSVGADVKGCGKVHIITLLVSCLSIRRIVHAMYTLDMSSRSAHRIVCRLSVSWMHTHSGCEFIFPTHLELGQLMVST